MFLLQVVALVPTHLGALCTAFLHAECFKRALQFCSKTFTSLQLPTFASLPRAPTFYCVCVNRGASRQTFCVPIRSFNFCINAFFVKILHVILTTAIKLSAKFNLLLGTYLTRKSSRIQQGLICVSRTDDDLSID